MTRPDTRSATPNGSAASDPQPSSSHAVPGPTDPAVTELLGRIVNLLEHRPGPAPAGTGAPVAVAADWTPATDTPAGDNPADGAPTTGAPTDDTPTDGAATTGTPTDDTATDDTATDDTATDDTATDDTAVRRRLRRIRVRSLSPARAAASVAIVVLAGATGWLGWDRSQADALNAARSQAVAAASAVATKMATYSYTSLTPAFAAVERDSTKAFAATYKKQSASLAGVLGQYKATSHGKVAVAAAEQVSASRAEVLVIVDQTIANSATSTPSTQANGLLLTMVHQGGRWLLANVAVR